MTDKLEQAAVCNWCGDDDECGSWATDCGKVFLIIDGKPSDNEMKFCCYCGKPIAEHPCSNEDDEE